MTVQGFVALHQAAKVWFYIVLFGCFAFKAFDLYTPNVHLGQA